MCSTHFITTTMGIKSNLSKWPQLHVIIFWRHWKTKGKKTQHTSSRTAKFAGDRWAAKADRGLSGSSWAWLSAASRAAGPMDRERAGALRGEALPWMCAGQGWKAPGCVSGQCCPPMALAQPAHCWTHTPQMLQRPRPHRMGHSRARAMSPRLLFQARVLWNSVPWSSWHCSHSPAPHNGPQPFPAFRSLYLIILLAL